jgi:hypothetical protein
VWPYPGPRPPKLGRRQRDMPPVEFFTDLKTG